MAVAGRRTGRRTCLVEVEGRQTMAGLFDTQPWDFTEREFRPGLWGLSIDPEASLAEYLEMFYGAKRISKLVVGSTAVEFATTAAPGLKDVLLIGKVKEMERRRDEDGRFHYDLIVLDAPPSGRIANFLRAPESTTELVNVGPIREQAQQVVDMLMDPARTHLQLVTILEEMPVAETVASIRELRELGVTVGPVTVNRVLRERFDEAAAKAFDEQLDAGELASTLGAAGLEVQDTTAAALRGLGEHHLRRLQLQQTMREELATKLSLPTLELPYLSSGTFERDEIEQLATLFERTAA
jgi:anion-transporting  ArsA/GET3 family ATPase